MVESKLTGMYSLLEDAYTGNWQYRWRDTPYLSKALREGKVESITSHSWGTMEFWFLLRRVCPNLGSLVDPIELYEVLLNHDLGETYRGDMPLFKKINGEIDDKVAERQGVKKLSEQLSGIGEELLNRFDEFEEEIGKVSKLEILVAKWIDTLQGNHFALTFGNELPEHSEPINRILEIRFIPYTNRLVEVLKSRGEEGATKEVREVVLHHAGLIKSAGISFDMSRLDV